MATVRRTHVHRKDNAFEPLQFGVFPFPPSSFAPPSPLLHFFMRCLGKLSALLCDKGCTTERHGNVSVAGYTEEGWVLGEIGKLVNIARTMELGVDPDLTPGRYMSTLSSCAPLIPLHAFNTRLPLDIDEEMFTSTYINFRTSKLSSLKHPSVLSSLEHASQCEAEIKQWLLDLPPAFRMGNEGMGEESCIPLRSSMALSSNASHGGTPPTLLAQRLDILMTTHRLAMGLYLSCLHPHSSSSSQSDSHFNVIHETSPTTHQARVEFGRGVEMGYSKALFDAPIICATSALRDSGAAWARTAMEDAKMGLGLLHDLRDLCPALDVSVLEALIWKLNSGGSGAGSGPKRKREGWDEGDGRDAVPVPGGTGAGGNGEGNVPIISIPVSSSREQKLRSSS
ncbi:hypothetical protein BD769DRAFT_1398156 [Suillus cothurnatus]|nr:hypothetical protein BD769DRAFT_1398156 [Suillus cothurnatus]